MELSVLQTFVDVVRHGSFAAVARERNIDPSLISRAIAGLEKELGFRLLQRTTRKLSLTEAGMTYLQRIEPLLEEMQQAVTMAADISGQPRGILRLTTSVAFGLKVLVPLLAEFRSKYPELVIDLVLTDRNVDLLAERIDVAIRLGILEDSSLIAEQLIQTRYRVCASPQYLDSQGHPTHPTQIQSYNCLLFPLVGFRSKWMFRDAAQNEIDVPVYGDTIISNAIALQQCAIAGMGLALLPNWLIDEDLMTGTLVDVFPRYDVTATEFWTSAWFVYPSRSYVPLKVRALIDFLKQSTLSKGDAGHE